MERPNIRPRRAVIAADAPRHRFLVTGQGGQVGENLRKTLAPLGDVIIPTRAELNLIDVNAIRRVVREIHPQWIVNAAAHTCVDRAETEPKLAFAVNARAPEVLAEEARKIDAVMIHYSTDYVFDGTKATPYVESDPTNPLNVYGESKLAGELALAANCAAYFTFRTSWVYGATGNNFVRSILRLARERDHLGIVADQYGAPTWSFELARLTAYVIDQIECVAEKNKCSLNEVAVPLSDLYHATSSGETSWYRFASQAIAEWQKDSQEVRFASLDPIATSAYPTKTKRPRNSLLDCSKLEKTFGWRMPDWTASLAIVVSQIKMNNALAVKSHDRQ